MVLIFIIWFVFFYGVSVGNTGESQSFFHTEIKQTNNEPAWMSTDFFPMEVRGTAHGISAAFGKLGAVAATVAYGYAGSHTKCWIVSWFGLIGGISTILFTPDSTGLDLEEQERYWDCVRRGRAEEYHGVAIHPGHLSWYEREVLKRHLNYDPNHDNLDRINALRREFQTMQGQQVGEEAGKALGPITLSEDVIKYFVLEELLRRDSQSSSNSVSK